MSHYDRSKDTMLIDLVSKRPILYSSSHPKHRNYIEKHRAWEEISAILDTPIPGLKQRWKHFRDHYHKKKKQTPKKAEWKYMNLLGFLSQQPKIDAPSEDETEKKDKKPRSSAVTRNDSSDFSNVSEFENDGSESASSTGSFTTSSCYEQAEMPKWANTDDNLGTLSKEIINQNPKHAETLKERENRKTLLMDKMLNSFALPGVSPSSSKSPLESRPGEMSLGINTNPNNDKKSDSITNEPTSNPRVSTQSIACGHNMWLETMERIGKSQKNSSVYKFFEAVAEVVSMLPPHLISEAKLKIHKSMYQIERECLGLDDDDEDL